MVASLLLADGQADGSLPGFRVRSAADADEWMWTGKVIMSFLAEPLGVVNRKRNRT
jgi:hypothetical protein